ncbi:uncharacterized protein LOC131163387 [Malania oleifera]|uniref:uncharacterized protein LOC131163387 n=1 Tax=Malania oleifera TaxID=397392 RepID=UPI0025ADA8D7|nr:uncharacterized protein LOC131163387 [Malania oleifera]
MHAKAKIKGAYEQASQIDRACKLNTFKSPPKLKDPGAPTISCVIDNYTIDRTLLDLGASVNLLPYLIFKQFNLGELKPTPVTLSFVDRSVKKPQGVIEDILVKFDKFYYLVDFIVLDMEPADPTKDQIPVLLGRPFLATANAYSSLPQWLYPLTPRNPAPEMPPLDCTNSPSSFADSSSSSDHVDPVSSHYPMRLCKPPSHLDSYVLASNSCYSPSFATFLVSLQSHCHLSSYKEATLDPIWQQTMNEELAALYKTDT